MSRRWACAVVVAVSLLTAGGCVINTGSIGERGVGMPHEAAKVGGGYTISYVLPEAGTVLLVDQRTQKHILSKSMEAGSEFAFDALNVDRAQYKKWGIDPDKANFVLYFHPKNPKKVAPKDGEAAAGNCGG